MMDWSVLDKDGAAVGTFSVDGASNARTIAFNMLVERYKSGGKLCKVNRDNSITDMFWIDTESAEFRRVGSDSEPWRPILRKMSIIHDEDWGIMDAELVQYQNVTAYAAMHGLGDDGYETERPQLCWCRTVVDREGTPTYEFFSKQLPKAFQVWVCRRVPE